MFSSDQYSGWHRIVTVEFVRRDEFFDLYVPGPENYVAEGFVNHNTGVGKGRIAAGIITDNMNQGRKKHIWVTKSSLYPDARRDWREMGQDPDKIFHFDDLAAGKQVPEDGVCFIPYDTLKGGKIAGDKARNIDTLSKWMGADKFDGAIIFDESHQMANATGREGPMGTVDASKRALAGMELQRRHPDARVAYLSATGATEVSNLAYASRLGLWGRGTAFANVGDFIAKLGKGGVAAMETVAQSMKGMGKYIARSLSFDDGTPKGRVEYDRLTHELTPDQHAQYDAAAEGWQHVQQHIDKALGLTGSEKNSRAVSAAKSAFWGAQQRFFNTVMTSMQTPSVIKAMEKDLAEGRSAVIQLTNTGAAALDRASKKRAAGDPKDAEEELDLSPKEVLTNYLLTSFPTQLSQEVTDELGNTTTEYIKDSAGNPVHDPRAIAMRDELIVRANSMLLPDPPIDMILNHFGHANVSEVTSRTKRQEPRRREDGSVGPQTVARSKGSNDAEAADFQAGKKRILVFSEAGGTGKSYHADRKAKNQQQRVHYVLQAGWKADAAVQGLGRTHRTNQDSAPIVKLVQIDKLKAQKRFISTIARRLDQLGALTKGQRETGSSGLFKAADNLESEQATDALEHLFKDLQGNRVPGLTFDDVVTKMGLKKADKPGRPTPPFETPPMNQFLNRMLSMKVADQGMLFDAFDQRLNHAVERAMANGTLDTGVETLKADKIVKTDDRVIYTDPGSGAEVRHVTYDVHQKTDKTPFESNQQGQNRPIMYVKNKRSGKVKAVYKHTPQTDTATGDVIERVGLRTPRGRIGTEYVPAHSVSGGPHDDFHERIDESQAKELWDAEHAKLPDTNVSERHYLTGALLPIWDRLPEDNPKVFRVDDGKEAMVGREIPENQVEMTMRKLGVSLDKKPAPGPAEAHAKLLDGTHTVRLANGWQIHRRRVQGENRLELTGPGMQHWNNLEQDGVDRVNIAYQPRMFIPSGDAGVKVLERIAKNYSPIMDAEPLRAP